MSQEAIFWVDMDKHTQMFHNNIKFDWNTPLCAHAAISAHKRKELTKLLK